MKRSAVATMVLALLLTVFSAVPGNAVAVSSMAVNATVTPPGGIKAVQTGGNTLGDVIREAEPRADGYRHIDTPATIQALRRLGVNTYVYLIWNSPTDWSDLVEEFAPAAERVGIRLWLYLVPPSECLDNPVKHLSGRCSRPYTTDYVRWAREIATLSVAHPNVVAWALDDFFNQLSPEKVEEMQRVQDAINPRVGFYTTVYYNDAVNGEFYDRYAGVIDGIIYPYTGANSNTQDATKVGPNLDAILAQTEPHGLGVVLLAYTGRYLGAMMPPTDRYIADVITETRPYVESGRLMGVTLYGLPIAGDPALTAANRARTGQGWLSFTPSAFGRTEAGHYAQASQRITVDPRASGYALEFADFDMYADRYETVPSYHVRQVLVDGEVVWESGRPGAGGVWQRRHVDLTNALRGKTSAMLVLRVTDRTSLALWTGILVDDVSGRGFRVRNGGFESDGAWTLSKNNDVILPQVDQYTDYLPSNALTAAARAFRGQPHTQRPGPPAPVGDAMYGTGRLRLSAAALTHTPAGACATASQVLTVADSPRYELDFFQTSPHAPHFGLDGRHLVTARIDGEVVWQRDVNSLYPLWENGNGLQGPIDVSDFATGKERVTLSLSLCGRPSDNTRPNPPVDIGFDNIRTIGLLGANLGFEQNGGWTLTSDAAELSAGIVRPAPRPEAPPVEVAAELVATRPGTEVTVPVTVTNSADRPMSGQLTAVAPAGWAVSPGGPFGPVPAGGSATVPLAVTVPADAAYGSHWLTVTAGRAWTTQRVQVVGDTVRFTPGTAAEQPWAADLASSQLNGKIFDGHGRFADGATYFTYRLDLPAEVTGGSLTLHIGNQFLVRVSTDGENWRTVLREEREIRDLSNLADRTLDLTQLRAGDGPLFVRVEDSFPTDGWGGWLGRLTVHTG